MKPAFTPEQLAGVFIARWQSRDFANQFIARLVVDTVIGRIFRSAA
jgi:hypothetical protein